MPPAFSKAVCPCTSDPRLTCPDRPYSALNVAEPCTWPSIAANDNCAFWNPDSVTNPNVTIPAAAASNEYDNCCNG